jgi:hypothetical protein
MRHLNVMQYINVSLKLAAGSFSGSAAGKPKHQAIRFSETFK